MTIRCPLFLWNQLFFSGEAAISFSFLEIIFPLLIHPQLPISVSRVFSIANAFLHFGYVTT